MKIEIKKGKPAEYPAEAIVLTRFEDSEAPAGATRFLGATIGALIDDVVKNGDFQGKLYQTAVLYTRDPIPARRVILAGLGPKKDLDMEKLRGAYAGAARQARALGLKEITLFLDVHDTGQTIRQMTEAALEGAILGIYQFTPYKTLEREKIKIIERITVVDDKDDALKEIRAAAKTAEVVAHAVYFARDLVSTPGNDMTPSDMAQAARRIAERKRVSVKVLDVAQMKKLGMHALLGVARGSDEPAKFIILEYRGAKRGESPIVLVGKGLTFDSGGISIKPSENMEEMKSDMAGGAAVMGAIMAAADLQLPLNVVGLVPATENLPGGNALKPGDILKSFSGQTIEVVNTDAEGRLILADALTYAQRFQPAAVIDLATLTGACKIALGDHVIGMLGNDGSLKEKIRTAGERTGERVWELPLWEDYHELIKSDVADFKNTGGRAGGVITAAAFLSKFVGACPWVHLDIAGPAWLAKDKPYAPKGATGIGVRLLVQCLRDWKRDAAPA
ncbi:MAG: leucyl aminopeptidase [Syntrophales bacterium]|nr:leucyl aminopeptidase [Syntrophales bacterium]